MKRNSLFFKFATSFGNERYRYCTDIDACELTFMFLGSVFWSILFGMFGLQVIWLFGSIIGETIGMIVTQTFERGIARSFYTAIGGVSLFACMYVALAFGAERTFKLLAWKPKKFCKIIELKD